MAEGRNDRDVTGRLVDVLATLSLVNAAELRELTATVFKTFLVPCSESVAEAMAEAGRLYHEYAGAIKSKPEAERADAQEQLGPRNVHVWVAFLRSLAVTRGLAPEHVAALKSHWQDFPECLVIIIIVVRPGGKDKAVRCVGSPWKPWAPSRKPDFRAFSATNCLQTPHAITDNVEHTKNHHHHHQWSRCYLRRPCGHRAVHTGGGISDAPP